MKKTLHPVHPGEVLLEDFMKPLRLSSYRVAKDIGVSPLRINDEVKILKRSDATLRPALLG